MHCQRKYTPEPKPRGYPAVLRQRAREMYVDGGNLRRVGRHWKVDHRTLEWALGLFSFAYNRGQLYKQRHPNYPAHLMDFVSAPN